MSWVDEPKLFALERYRARQQRLNRDGQHRLRQAKTPVELQANKVKVPAINRHRHCNARCARVPNQNRAVNRECCRQQLNARRLVAL